MMLRTADRPLRGRRILIVEDQFLIAEDMRRLVEQLGGKVAGPARDVARARALLQTDAVDTALLDINLDGVEVYGFASELRRKGVPMIFATGYEAAGLPAAFADAPHLQKPVTGAALVDAFERLALSSTEGPR